MTQTYGPPPSPGKVKWLAIHNDGTEKVVEAQTAFQAAQAAGWTFSEIATLRTFGMPEVVK